MKDESENLESQAQTARIMPSRSIQPSNPGLQVVNTGGGPTVRTVVTPGSVRKVKAGLIISAAALGCLHDGCWG